MSHKNIRIQKHCRLCLAMFTVQPSKVERITTCTKCRSIFRKPPTNIPCRGCGRVFIVKGHLKDIQFFCSRVCRWNAIDHSPRARKKPTHLLHAQQLALILRAQPRKKIAIKRPCLECRKPFLARHMRQRYCTQSCVAASQKREDYCCDHCQQPFHKERKKTNKSALRFCSAICRSAYMTGENHPNYVGEHKDRRDYRGLGWDNLAESIRQRDNYACQRCGAQQLGDRALDVHHIEPYRVTHNNHPDNLIALCQRCHKIVESSPSLLALPARS